MGGYASDKVSTMTGRSSKGPRTNSKGESHCFHCGAADHWAYKCPELSGEQQDQLHMTLQGEGEGGNIGQEEGPQLLNMALVQGGALPDNQAYLDGCSTGTAFKSKKYLKGVKMLARGIRINCNTGAVTTNRKGMYGKLQVWYLPKGIVNIFSMHELENTCCITYDSWDGYYAVHMPQGEVLSYKEKQGLSYINLEGTDQDVAMMLVQEHVGTNELDEGKGMSLVQMVHGKYEGYAKKEVLQAKEVRRA